MNNSNSIINEMNAFFLHIFEVFTAVDEFYRTLYFISIVLGDRNLALKIGFTVKQKQIQNYFLLDVSCFLLKELFF